MHLKDVSRAARQGVLLAVAAMVLAILAVLASGLSPALALLAGAGVLATGVASGGFGLVARIALPSRTPPRRPSTAAGRTVGRLRIPQTR